jgi:hypothetical protein
MPAGMDSGEFERGKIEGRMAAVEDALTDIKADQRRLFVGQEEIKVTLGQMATVLGQQKAQTDSFLRQCQTCQTTQANVEARVRDVEREVDTDVIKRKLRPTSDRAKWPQTDADLTIGQAFAKGASGAIVKIIEYGIILLIVGGSLAAMGMLT